MSHRLALPLCLALLSACLETEERLVVHEDGSVSASIRVEGDGWDLADGYPLPVEGNWTADDAQTQEWLDAMRLPTPDVWVPPSDRLELRVEGRFPSVAALPERFAPSTDPYAASFQRRTTTLEVRRLEGRTVWIFERTYAGQDELFRIAHDWDERRLDQLPESIRERDEDDETPLTADEWEVCVEALRDIYRNGARLLVREATAPLWTAGDAPLPAEAAAQLQERIAQAVAAEIRTADFVEHERALLAGEIAESAKGPADRADERARQVLREQLEAGLDAAGVPAAARNAVLARAETLLAAWDQADDLADESITFAVTLPGRLVAGNFADSDGATATWHVKAEHLLDGDIVLRAVSVVE